MRKLVARGFDWTKENKLGWNYVVWINNNRHFFKSYKDASLYYDKQKQSKNCWDHIVIELIYKNEKN